MPITEIVEALHTVGHCLFTFCLWVESSNICVGFEVIVR